MISFESPSNMISQMGRGRSGTISFPPPVKPCAEGWKRAASYFFPILREISSKIFGRKSARTLSTMLAMAAGSD